MRTYKILARVVGSVALLFSAFSVLFGAIVAIGMYGSPPKDVEPYFFQSFFVIAGCVFMLSLLLGFSGWSMLKLRTGRWWLLSAVCIAFYFFMHEIGALWLHPEFGMSIAAATGIGLGGLAPIEASYFYIWGPLLAVLCHVFLRNECNNAERSKIK